jgi:ribonucleotide monophosphatase NagD (HAD superfamily)
VCSVVLAVNSQNKINKITNKPDKNANIFVIGNEAADDAAKEELNEETHHTETYPPQDLMAWIKGKHEQEQQEKWENSTTTMKERKLHQIMRTNTKTMTSTDIWHCKETETKRLHIDITKEIWKDGKQEMEKLIR